MALGAVRVALGLRKNCDWRRALQSSFCELAVVQVVALVSTWSYRQYVAD